jgi:type IV secretory pathway VirJ component
MNRRLARVRARVGYLLPAVLLAAASLGWTRPAWQSTRQTLDIRGHQQTLYLYGPPQGDPVIVSSGDGGWVHLGPHVAELLAARGFFVVGFDVKAYLESFTGRASRLRQEDEPGDYHVLAEFAKKPAGKRPVLVGVSEGAGLSVLAATDPATKADIAGVVGLGLPDMNELAWHWRDAIIYLTHRAPDEPMFSTAALVDRVAPLPLAAIHSTHDEFVPLADIERVMGRARDPKRLWIVDASNHRFSDKLDEFDRRLLEAIAWVKDNTLR